jgi:hypothetical protein
MSEESENDFVNWAAVGGTDPIILLGAPINSKIYVRRIVCSFVAQITSNIRFKTLGLQSIRIVFKTKHGGSNDTCMERWVENLM